MSSKLKIIIAFILLISACHKEQISDDPLSTNPAKKITLPLHDAKEFITGIDPDSGKAIAKIKIDWELAKSESTKEGNKFTILLKGQPTYQNIKQGYRQLIILRNQKTEKIEAKILEIIPDAIHLQKKQIAKTSDFTGRVFEYNLNYKLTGGRLYSEGKPVGSIQQFSQQDQITQANQTLKEVNPFSGAQGKLMLYAPATCNWLQDYYIDAEGDFTVHSTKVCSTTYFDDSGSGGGGGYYDGVGGDPSGPQHGGSGS
ncbi:hypothetical protein [Pedobacter miscanthi]|uniref:hypothetical protein n=1 Tax=Pedobacter miscanthi TaxID=2259170 RepID=UPI00292EB27C|nr:hypothetical protein [Pedobacter miscanthi]